MSVRWNINHKIAVIRAIKLFVLNNNVELPMAYTELEECFVVVQRALGYEKRKLLRTSTVTSIKTMIDEIYPRTQDEILFCLADKNTSIKKHRDLNHWSHLTVDSEMRLIPPVHEFINEHHEPILSPDVPVVKKGYSKKAKAAIPVYKKEDMKLVVVIGLGIADKRALEKKYNGKPIEFHCVTSESSNKISQACSKVNADMFVLFTNFMHHSSYQFVKNAIKAKNKIERINGGFSSLFPVLDKLIQG